MGYGPSDAQIGNFVEFTGAGQSDAIAFLTREPNFEKAVQNYYDAQERGTSGAAPSYSAWDESDMHAGKEYGPVTNPSNSYQIHAVDNAQTLGPEIFNGSLSRPPSRVDVKLDDKEDADLQHGLINSMSSSRHEANTASFGPANRDHYPTNQWALTTTSQHVLPDPDPANRARKLSSPAFLKPSTSENRLSNLLTIYKQIPLAFETLLLQDHVRSEYGTSSDWWQGDAIRPRGAVVSTDDQSHVDKQSPVLDEIQRLMAFLELTDRAYGSSDPLKEALDSSKHAPWGGGTDVDSLLLQVWLEECKELLGHDVKRDIFTTTAIERIDGEITDTNTFQTFRLSVQYATEIETLYDLIDEVLWGMWVPDSPNEVFIKPGEIMTLHMTRNQRSSGGINPNPLTWPLVFYVDRYLEENKDAITKMLVMQADIEAERNSIQLLQTKLEHVKSSVGSSGIAATELLKIVKPFLDGERVPIDELERRDEDVASGAKYHALDDYKSISKELELVADSILRKHEALEQAKFQLTTRKKAVTDFLKEPVELNGDNPVHRYTLRGISIDANTTFVLANPNSADDLLDTEVDNWDWWKIHWDSQKENPVDVQVIPVAEFNDVVQRANEVIAVYASDRAVNQQRKSVIPQALKNFVRADNLHFASEIEHPELSAAKRKAESQDWSHIKDSAFDNYHQTRSRNSSVDSMQANLDTDMNDSWMAGGDDDVSDWRSPTPPPIPPRTSEFHRKAPKRPMVKNLIDVDDEAQESGTVSLMDDNTRYDQEMQEVNSSRLDTMGIVPGGPQSGVSDSVGGSAAYASEIQMTDIIETEVQPSSGLPFSHKTVDPSKTSTTSDKA